MPDHSVGDKDTPRIAFKTPGLHLRVPMLKASFKKCTFHFDFDARTSRGAMKERISWFIKIWDEQAPEVLGWGECAPLPGLSRENLTTLDETVAHTVGRINFSQWQMPKLSGPLLERLTAVHDLLKEHFSVTFLASHPALVLALETALLDLNNGGTRTICDAPFNSGQGIPINGLIWMGGLDFMLQQIEIKIREGFTCLKVKVGGLNFEKDCDILQYIRRKYFREDITVRLDANGYFKAEDVMFRLNGLAKYGVHSIEQPMKAGAAELPSLVQSSPIPIALDEELIPVGADQKEELLERIKPHFIILKPSLHGGLLGCMEWIKYAEARKIGWWITSALESSIGLNAISQFASYYKVEIPQGLGTGQIYNDNLESPMRVKKGVLTKDPNGEWDLSRLQEAGIPD